MNLRSCDECGSVYDTDKVNLPSEEQMDYAFENGNTDGICEWNGDGYTPVFRCLCGNYVQVVE